MTDKEWKELCEWAKNHSDKICLMGVDGVCHQIGLYFNESENIEFNRYGDVRIKISNTNIFTSIDIVENRTPQQIKAIIENLL